MRKILQVVLGSLVVPALTACGSPTEPPTRLIVEPQCSAPARLIGADARRYADRVIDDYIVTLKYGTEVDIEASRLGRKYGFATKNIYPTAGFLAELSPATAAGLRCEASVESLQFANILTPTP